MSQVTEIRTLQEIDDELAARRGTLDDVQRRLGGSPQLEVARERAASADAALAGVRSEQRRIEAEIAGLNARIAPEEKRLYDGSVRNPKELGNIQHEVDFLKQHRSEFEDQLLEVLQRLEAAEAEHAAAKAALAGAESEWASEHADLQRQATALAAQVASAEERRTGQATKVTARNIAVYEDVRRRRGGIAVSRIAGGNCGGCRVSVPETVRRRAFTADQLAQCPNCERILYVG